MMHGMVPPFMVVSLLPGEHLTAIQRRTRNGPMYIGLAFLLAIIFLTILLLVVAPITNISEYLFITCFSY